MRHSFAHTWHIGPVPGGQVTSNTFGFGFFTQLMPRVSHDAKWMSSPLPLLGPGWPSIPIPRSAADFGPDAYELKCCICSREV